MKYGGMTTMNFKDQFRNKIDVLLNNVNLKRSQKILFNRVTPTGSINIELILSTALRLRGYNTTFFVCNDGIQSGCSLQRDFESKSCRLFDQNVCNSCIKKAQSFFYLYNDNYLAMSNYISKEKLLEIRNISDSLELDNIFHYSFDGIFIGKFVESSLLRYFKGAPFIKYEREIREFLYGTMITIYTTNKMLETYKPDVIISSHAGYYTDYGPIGPLAKRFNIRLISYQDAYRKKCIYMTEIEYGKRICAIHLHDSQWKKYSKQSLTDQQDKMLNNYYKGRYELGHAWDMKDLAKSSISGVDLLKHLKIKHDKPIWCFFSHMNWDAVTDQFEMIFKDFNELTIKTVQTMITIKNVTWLIKIHPIEKVYPQKYGITQLIQKHFSRLPDHIKIIPADAQFNSFDLYQLIDGGISAHGTVGLELTSLGKPFILAGSSPYSNKGFTFLANTVSEYEVLLKKCSTIKKLTYEQFQKARVCAYLLFNRKQIPLSVLNDDNAFWKIPSNVDKLDFLIPRNDPIIDMICDRIVNGGDFILDDNFYEQANQLNELGLKSFLNGDNNKAIEFFSKALDIDPMLAITYSNLGAVYWKMNSYNNAMKYFSTAFSIDKHNKTIIVNLGKALTKLNKLKDAKDLYLFYLSKHPHDNELQCLLDKL